MWEFGFFRALGLLVRTLPFLVYRAVVCLGIALVLAFGAATGALIGGLFAAVDGEATFAVWGALAGLLLVGGLIQTRRARLLYSLRARHIALMVEALDHRPVPFSTGQFNLAGTLVATRFRDIEAFSALDRLISSVVRTATRMVDGLLEGILPVSILDRLVRGTGLHIWLARPLIEAAILSHSLRTRSENAWEAAHDGLVLYTQNARAMMGTALWLQWVGWAIAGLVLLVALGPAATLAAQLPPVAGTATLLAVLIAGAVKAALYDPFAVACMVRLHRQLTEGQEPLGEWRGRLTQVSDKFRQLGERALGWNAGREAGN
ncbi:MAG TPA: hypothetical protein VK146_15420 [Tabrizicola sp.]|nr:hypothetical protein [Tabrizicola sp.]